MIWGIEGMSTLAQIRARIARSQHDALVDLTQIKSEDIQALPTGSFLLDQAIGVGGYPFGRVIELFGPESCGKSTSALHAIACAQSEKNPTGSPEPCMYIDYEHDFDIAYAKSLGVDISPDKLIYIQPSTFEEGMTCALPFIQEGKVRVVVIDSVAAMLPMDNVPGLAQDKPSMGEQKQPMTQARLMAMMLQQIRPIVSEQGIVFILLNQTRDVIDMTGHGRRGRFKKVSTPGGKALKFYCSVRIEFQPIQGLKGKIIDLATGEQKDQVVATKIRATVVKNKVAAPYQKAEFIIRFGVGIDEILSIVHCAVARNLGVVKDKAIYTLDPALLVKDVPAKIRGINDVIKYFEANTEQFDILKEGLRRQIVTEREETKELSTEIED